MISFEEACSYLELSSGPGWPYSLLYRTKSDVLYSSRPCDLESAVAFLMNGGRCFWSISPKEEARPTDKLEADNIRMFKVGPIDLNILGIMCSRRFTECITEAWRYLPITIGICLYYGGWDYLLRRLRFKTTSNDAPKWDGHFVPELIEIAFEIIKRFSYRDTFPYLDVLMSNILQHPALFMNGLGIWQFGGMPSGAPITIFLNSLGRLFLLVYFIVWHFSQEKRGVRSEDIAECCDILVHGDDSNHGSKWEWFTHDRLNHLYGEVLHWNTYFIPYQLEPVVADQFRYLSHITAKIDGIFVPVHESRSKILTSLICGNAIEIPVGETRESYTLTRFWSIVNTCFTDSHFWERLVKVGIAYEKRYDALYSNVICWQRAKALRRDRDYLVRFFTKPDLVQLQKDF